MKMSMNLKSLRMSKRLPLKKQKILRIQRKQTKQRTQRKQMRQRTMAYCSRTMCCLMTIPGR